MATETVIHSDLAIPPGEFLEEVIESLGMTKEELAARMGRPASKLSQIFSGAKAITPETALQLEHVTAVPASLWLGLESEYQLVRARNLEWKELANAKWEQLLVTSYCYRDLVQQQLVADWPKPIDRVREMRQFFGVRSLEVVPQLRRYQSAFRIGKSGRETPSPHAIASWLRMGELAATKLETAPFDPKALRKNSREIRGLTPAAPEEFIPRLEKLLAAAGVALVIRPHLPRTYAHGATFRLKKDKAVLMLSIRGRWADIFWFSLFHEIGHILLHKLPEPIVEGDQALGTSEAMDREADEFARDTLIPPVEFNRFAQAAAFDAGAIRRFAREMGIAPGIVVGRLQHEKLLPHDKLNTLRVRYQLKTREKK